VEARDPATPGLGEGRAPHRNEAEVEFNRIVSFSDGVFAIAITLLTFGLFIPEGVSNVTHTLLEQWPDLFAYGISFAVIGKFWLAHHRFFAALERFDGPLMALNLVYLAFIALLPFTSQVLGDYGREVATIVVYATNLACVNLAFHGEILYALRHDMLRPGAREDERRYDVPTNLILAGVFIASIPVAFASTLAATLMWLAVFLVGARVSNRLAGLGA
jgi:uncharacterized membrane protein